MTQPPKPPNKSQGSSDQPKAPPRKQPQMPAQRTTYVIRQESSGPWKSLVFFAIGLILVAAGIYYWKKNQAPEVVPVVVSKKPQVDDTPVKLPDIVSNPEKDGERPPPVDFHEEEETPVIIKPEPPPPFVTKLRVTKARKNENPSKIDKEIWAIAPTQNKPLKVPLGNTGFRSEIGKLLEQYEAIPANRIVANPLAEDFPGAVPDDAQRVIKPMNLEQSVGRWHSTGIYAAPGEIITIRISSSDTKIGLRARIGCHRDDILNSKRESWHRFPRITRSVALTERSTEIANPFGGAVYIEMAGSNPKSRKRIRVEVVGGVEAPYYKLGETSDADWKHIRNAPAPWAEMAGNNIVLSVPSKLVRELEDPKKLMELWDKIIEIQDWLAAWPKRVTPERLVPDAEISAGWMHSGYPVMCYMASAPGMVDYEYLTTQGDWGFYHEYGHNHQSGAWTFQGYGEVTNNLFSLYCMEKISGKPLGGGHSDMDKMLAVKLADPHGANGAFENLSIYVPVIKEFGWESLRNTFAEYRKKRKYRLDTDDHKKETFVRLWSKHCKANLGPYFEKVGYPYTNSMKSSLTQYKAWMPPLPSLKEGESAPSTLFGSKNESAATRDGADKGSDATPQDEDPEESGGE